MADAPVPPPLLVYGLVALPAIDGSSCSRSPTVALPVAAICSWLTVTTGLAVSVSTRRRREPVTTTLSSVCGASPLLPACCADTGALTPADSASSNAALSMLGTGRVGVPEVREKGNSGIGMQGS